MSMWVATLIGEEVFDALQREHLKDESVQPLVRAVMRIHVAEEA
ncbi:diiron oxygenase, partial [Amycolatopsis sp. H20-H5]